MNLTALGRALGFMFLPTFAILVVLVVGFFDPVAMWVWIKSNNEWAVVIRVIMLIAEGVLVYVMYCKYLKEEIRKNASKGEFSKSDSETVSYHTDVYRLFEGASGNDTYKKYYTLSSNIVIVERIPEIKD